MGWVQSSFGWSAQGSLAIALGTAAFLFNSIAGTNVSLIPDLTYYEGMKRIVGASATDALVTSFDDNGPLIHIAYDGWQWQEVERHNTTDWLGIPRLSGRELYCYGDEVLVLDSSRVLDNGVHVPEISVLQKQDGSYVTAGKVSFESLLGGAGYYYGSVEDVCQTTDLLLLRMSIGAVGVGGEQWQHCFVRTDAGWQAGPGIKLPTGWWWPLFSERVGGVLHLYTLQMQGIYDGSPQTFVMSEYSLQDDQWQHVRQLAEFVTTPQWVASNYVRTVLSPDRTSLLLLNSDTELNPVRPVELVRDGDTWTFAGELSLDSPTGLDLYTVQVGDGIALLRADKAIAQMYDPPLQHYHLLQHVDGAWTLVGDAPSHRTLYDYWQGGLSFSLCGDRLTVFDFSPWNEAARAYTLDDLQPIAIKWFRDSVSAGAGWESLPAFGFFNPQFTTSRAAIWLWHANLGWLYAAGRDPAGFWFWQPATGWTWFNDQFFDLSAGMAWLYSNLIGDYLWFEAQSANPRFFYSYHYGEWISEAEAPAYDAPSMAALAEQMASELQAEGVTFEIDTENARAIFSATETVEGKQVTIRIEAPWQYIPHADYPSHARFTLDLSWILVTIDGETVGIHASQLWTEAKVLLPMLLSMDFFFLSPDSGVAVTVVEYNNGTADPPVRETFAP